MHDEEPLRVGLLIPSFTRGGGAESVARDWARLLSAAGDDVVVLTYTDGDAPEAAAVRELRFPYRSTLSRWLLLPRWVRRVSYEQRLDVLLSVLDFSNLTALRALKLRRSHVRVVISEHSLPSLLWPYDGIGGRVKSGLARGLYRRADAAIAVSHGVAADLRAALHTRADRTIVVPNVVASAANPRPGAPGGSTLRRLIFVGRLVPEKRPELVLDVLECLARRGVTATALIAGDGPLRSELEREARRRHLPVELAGWVSDWTTSTRPGDCVVLPSAVEGLGNVLVEAAAAGVPSVAPSSAIGVADAIVPGLTGVLATASSASALADAALAAMRIRWEPEAVKAWLAHFSESSVGPSVHSAVHRSRRSAALTLTVLHVGPGPDGAGGMSSALAAVRSMVSERVRPCFVVSYVAGSRWASAWPFLRSALHLLRTSRRNVIVHAHLSFGGCFVREGALMALAAMRGLPVVATLHGSDFPEFLEAHPRLVHMVLARADRLVVLQPGAAATVPARFANRVVAIPNAVTVPEQSTPAADTPPVAVFVGEVSTRKGVDVLLDAWARVSACVPGARLVIAGPLVDLPAPAAPAVEWVGEVEHQKVPELLRGARVAVLPSRREVMPVFLLEAMAAARPVVSTDAGVIREAVGDGGSIVGVGDIVGLADALARFLVDPLLAQRVGEVAHERVRTHFGIDAVSVTMSQLYEGVFDDRRWAS